jgi:hypothetical protein
MFGMVFIDADSSLLYWIVVNIRYDHFLSSVLILLSYKISFPGFSVTWY